MVGIGVVVMLLTVPLPSRGAEIGVVALAALAVAAVVGLRLLRGPVDAGRGPRPAWRAAAGGAARSRCARFSAGHPARLWRVYALDLGFHALAVLETLSDARLAARRQRRRWRRRSSSRR